MTAPTVTGWYQVGPAFVASVNALPLGSGHTLVHIDLTSEGKRAEPYCCLGEEDGKVIVCLSVQADEKTTRESHLFLRTLPGTLVEATSWGRYTIFLLLRHGSLDLGPEIPEVPVDPADAARWTGTC